MRRASCEYDTAIKKAKYSRMKNLTFLPGLIFCLSLASNLCGQQRDRLFDFDAVYSTGMQHLNFDRDRARESMTELEKFQKHLSSVQKAKASFFKLKFILSDSSLVQALDKRMFAAPDSLPPREAHIFSARKYLERSMPDKAIPLLLHAMDSLKDTSNMAVFIRIGSVKYCDAYSLNEKNGNKHPRQHAYYPCQQNFYFVHRHLPATQL